MKEKDCLVHWAGREGGARGGCLPERQPQAGLGLRPLHVPCAQTKALSRAGIRETREDLKH